MAKLFQKKFLMIMKNNSTKLSNPSNTIKPFVM